MIDGRMLIVLAGVWLAYRAACWIHDRAQRTTNHEIGSHNADR